MPELAAQILVTFNDRFTARAGVAFYRRNLIQLSSQLWVRASEDQHKQTVIHETCHIIAFYKYGYRGIGHNELWKLCMRACGLEPKRCHNIDDKDLRCKNTRVIAHCACKSKEISSNLRTRILKGNVYTCIVCNHDIKL